MNTIYPLFSYYNTITQELKLHDTDKTYIKLFVKDWYFMYQITTEVNILPIVQNTQTQHIS